MNDREQHLRNKITIISFACSILVIYIHANNLTTYGIDAKAVGFSRAVYVIQTYWANVTRIAVPMFFLISGFLLFRTFEPSKMLDKWKTRAFSILLPYIIWCTIYYIYFILCTNIPVLSNLVGSTTPVPISLAEWLRWLWVDEYYTLWFLKSLIIYIALTPLIWLLLKNHLSKVPTGLIILLVIIILKNQLQLNSELLADIEEYLIGSYIGINLSSWTYYKNKKLSIISLIYIAIMALTAFAYWNTVTEILLFLAIWFVLDLITIPSDKALPWWMSITFFTYVAHDIPLEALEKVIFILGGSTSPMALLDYIFAPLIIEVVLIFIAYILIRLTPKLWSLLSGGRDVHI